MKRQKGGWWTLAARGLLCLSLMMLLLDAGANAKMADDNALQPAAAQENQVRACVSANVVNKKGKVLLPFILGTKGEGGTTFSGGEVNMASGGASGTGSIDIPMTVTWSNGSTDSGFLRLRVPLLWVDVACSGIDATVTLSGLTVNEVNKVTGGILMTGTVPPVTITLTAGTVTGAVATGFPVNLPATPITYTNPGWVYNDVVSGTATATVAAHD